MPATSAVAAISVLVCLRMGHSPLLRSVRLPIGHGSGGYRGAVKLPSIEKRPPNRPSRRDAVSAAIIDPTEWPTSPIGGFRKERPHGVSDHPIDWRAGVAIKIDWPH